MRVEQAGTDGRRTDGVGETGRRKEKGKKKKRRKIFVRLDSVNENIKKERREAMFGEQGVT